MLFFFFLIIIIFLILLRYRKMWFTIVWHKYFIRESNCSMAAGFIPYQSHTFKTNSSLQKKNKQTNIYLICETLDRKHHSSVTIWSMRCDWAFCLICERVVTAILYTFALLFKISHLRRYYDNPIVLIENSHLFLNEK